MINLCGADIDLLDSLGCSSLFYAVTLGQADCTQFLLQNGAESNLQDIKGRTAAHCGAYKGQFETLKILANHGANLWIRNVRGDLPLHEAIKSGRRGLIDLNHLLLSILSYYNLLLQIWSDGYFSYIQTQSISVIQLDEHRFILHH